VLNLPPKHDPSAILEDLERFFSRFLVLADGLPLVLALWSLGTHLFEVFDAFPYLAITSPTKRCGKTRVCEMISFVCFQPLQTVSISSAALYRILGEDKRTLLIDEAESLSRPRDEKAATLREILNSGYRKGSVVVRCKRKSKGTESQESEETYETENFGTYCPKALVLIGRLQDTLADRCIEIRMERRAGVEVERFRFARVQAEMLPLQGAAISWARLYRRKVEDYYQNNDLPHLQDRESELWLALFSVCAIAAPDRLFELQLISQQLADTKSEDEPADYSLQLLRDCQRVFDQAKVDRLPTATILHLLNSHEDRPWAGWSRGRGLDAHNLSRLLRPFQIHPQNLRISLQVAKGYLRQSFQGCWERYL
jgi:Protein of unknown function (DUF3631)